MNATIFASALKSSSCCINIVFGFGGKSKSDATIPDVVGCRSPSFALIGYGICLESEKIYTFVKIFCYLCHCNKGTPTYSRPVQ